MTDDGGALPQVIIRKKRDGGELSESEIGAVVRGLVDGSWSEGQIAAFAMTVFYRGMTRDECVAMTRAMTTSGTVIDWGPLDLDGPVVDKHSTGGVGDKVSLVLAPLVAACGGVVPMVSGRGLEHTGGTLDKLDAIPGYTSDPDLAHFQRVVKEVGCAVVGQDVDLAPADGRMYAIRDVTATVDSIELITASILSKKLASGLGALVMDVKFGTGAFSDSIEDAAALAESLVDVACGAGLPTTALLTDMNQVLGRTAGNAVEVREVVEHLTGENRDPRFHDLVMALAADLLVRAGLAGGDDEAHAALQAALDDGRAAERFARMVTGLGGPADLLENPDDHLRYAPVTIPAFPAAAGHVTRIDVRRVGLLIVELGGGRRFPGAAIDHTVGLTDVAGLGEAVGPERPLALVHARTQADANRTADALRTLFTVGDTTVAPGPIVADRRGDASA